MESKHNIADAAKSYWSDGYPVLPTRAYNSKADGAGKATVLPWKGGLPGQDAVIAKFESGSRYANLWLKTGQASATLVIDCDNPGADSYWRTVLGDELLDSTAAVSTRQGTHYYFRLDEPFDGWAKHDDLLDYDVRADEGGVVVPPSVHPTGHVYTWIRGLDVIKDAPLDLIRKIKSADGRKAGASVDTRVKSMMSSLLGSPPAEGGRNVWLSKVAGHLASPRTFEHQDAFLSLLHLLNESALDAPLDRGEVDAMLGIWAKERGKPDPGIEFEIDNGWLKGTGKTLIVECAMKGDDNQPSTYGMQWADFDVHVIGVSDEERGRIYVVDIRTNDGRTYSRQQIRPVDLSGSRELTSFLARYGCTIAEPEGVSHWVQENRRLARYLRAQDAPAYRGVDHLGWNPEIGFVTHEGVLTGTGMQPHTDIAPALELEKWAPYEYGFEGTREQALATLREVLTFQDARTVALFGAWWSMAILKGQYHAPLFPYMAIESGSESGKTTGFFALMVALAGNKAGHGQFTVAAARDAMSAHRNGVLWLDDITDLGAIADLLREATSEGSRSKKGQDFQSTEIVTLRSPTVISGEGMGSIMAEKAQRDRSIRLSPPSPTKRMSLHDPGMPQWEDVTSLMAQYGGEAVGLSSVAGWIVGAVLGRAGMLDELRGLLPGAGRHAEKIGIMRMGARILADIAGPEFGWIVEQTDAWASEQQDDGGVNLVLRKVVPWSLRVNGMPDSARGYIPAYADRDGVVWVSAEALADAWGGRMGLSPRERQLGTVEAIQSELRTIGAKSGHRKDVGDSGRDNRIQRYYWRLSPDQSALVLSQTGFVDLDVTQ